jgi:polyribonucleotide 5'-hydroxyl-kinase
MSEQSKKQGTAQKGPRMIELKKEEELRFEVDHQHEILLILLSGNAEIFGTELAPNITYKFQGVKLAVFTWQGATLSIEGQTQSEYTASETPMAEYISLHQRFEQERIKESGPRVLIVGPTDSGKSSLSRILCTYAARVGRKLFYVDLDVGQNGITSPGTISAVQVTEPFDITEGFGQLAPLSFFYGHADIAENTVLYKKLNERLAELLDMKMQKDVELKRGGMIVNTCGYVDGIGYQLLLHAAKTFHANHILVLGDDRLTANLKRDLQNIEIERITKSGGVVTRSSQYRRKARMNKIREYFYGINDSLSPHSIIVKFEDVHIVKIGGIMSAPKSALPIGAKSSIDPVEIRDVDPNTDQTLMHSVLGLSHANKKEDVLTANLAGLLYVEKVDVNKKELTVLSPSPGKLPKKFLIAGTLKWLQ